MGELFQGVSVRIDHAPETDGFGSSGSSATREQLLSIWNRLLDRELEVVETLATVEHAYLVVRERAPDALVVSDRNRAILEKTLLGACRKVISDELGVTTSTLAQLLRRLLLRLGLDCSPARVPEPLVQLVHAAYGYFPASLARVRRIQSEEGVLLVLSYAFEGAFLEELTPAESAVLRERLAGRSYADIAKRRNTSCRTVANQVAAATQRLGVSGRLELLHAMYSSRADQH